MFRPFDPMLDSEGKLRPFYRTARERGLRFDVRHGSGSLLFKWVRPAASRLSFMSTRRQRPHLPRLTATPQEVDRALTDAFR